MTIESRKASEAIFDGDIEAFDNLISRGLEVGYVSEKEKWNFLHTALVSVDFKTPIEMINHLIKKGVNVNGRDYHGWTPLHFASRNKYSEAIKELIQGGALVDPLNDEKVTPLRLTLSQLPFNIEATRILLENGANPDHDECGVSIRELAKIICHGDNKEISDTINSY